LADAQLFKAWKMKNNVDEALKSHMRELEEFYGAPRPKEAKPKIFAQDRRRLESAFENAAARRAPRGRPPAWESRNERTYQSFAAFVFVTGEMRTYRMRNGTRGVPVKVIDEFIKFAKRDYPRADEHLILEHIRKDQRLLPDFKEPVCFLLVRHEYKWGRTANVIVAAPSDMRR
jgi:hypothetical protein